MSHDSRMTDGCASDGCWRLLVKHTVVQVHGAGDVGCASGGHACNMSIKWSLYKSQLEKLLVTLILPLPTPPLGPALPTPPLGVQWLTVFSLKVVCKVLSLRFRWAV